MADGAPDAAQPVTQLLDRNHQRVEGGLRLRRQFGQAERGFRTVPARAPAAHERPRCGRRRARNRIAEVDCSPRDSIRRASPSRPAAAPLLKAAARPVIALRRRRRASDWPFDADNRKARPSAGFANTLITGRCGLLRHVVDDLPARRRARLIPLFAVEDAVVVASRSARAASFDPASIRAAVPRPRDPGSRR